MDWRLVAARLVLDMARRDGVTPVVVCLTYGIPPDTLVPTFDDSHRTRYLDRTPADPPNAPEE